MSSTLTPPPSRFAGLDLLYDRVSYLLDSEMTLEPMHASCGICGRQPQETRTKLGGYHKNSYGKTLFMCRECLSIHMCKPSLLDYKENTTRVSKKTGKEAPRIVPRRLTDWPGAALAIEAREGGRVILMVVPSNYEKIPDALKEVIEVIPATGPDHVPIILREKLQFPLLYIQSLGSKALDMITGLEISPNPRTLLGCIDDAKVSNKIMRTTDLVAAEELALMIVANKKLFNKFTAIVADFARGKITPKERVALVEKEPLFAPMFEALPKDPYVQMNTLAAAQRIVEKLYTGASA